MILYQLIYLTCFQCYQSAGPLGYSGTSLLAVPKCRTKSSGETAFGFYALCLLKVMFFHTNLKPTSFDFG